MCADTTNHNSVLKRSHGFINPFDCIVNIPFKTECFVQSEKSGKVSCLVQRCVRFIYSYLAISRKVVGKSARDNPERHCGWFCVLFFSTKFERIGRKGHGNVFASAKGKQQK